MTVNLNCIVCGKPKKFSRWKKPRCSECQKAWLAEQGKLAWTRRTRYVYEWMERKKQREMGLLPPKKKRKGVYLNDAPVTGDVDAGTVALIKVVIKAAKLTVRLDVCPKRGKTAETAVFVDGKETDGTS